jgi:hypothetical protein
LTLKSIVDLVEDFRSFSSTIKQISVILLSRVLLAVHPSVSAFKNVVHISNSNFSATIWGYRALLIFFERHVIVFNSFCKVASLVFASSTGVSGIDMIGVDLKYGREIVNTLF